MYSFGGIRPMQCGQSSTQPILHCLVNWPCVGAGNSRSARLGDRVPCDEFERLNCRIELANLARNTWSTSGTRGKHSSMWTVAAAVTRCDSSSNSRSNMRLKPFVGASVAAFKYEEGQGHQQSCYLSIGGSAWFGATRLSRSFNGLATVVSVDRSL